MHHAGLVAVREYLSTNRKATGKEVVARLGEKGVEVQEGLVYFVKGKLKVKRQRRRKVMRAAKKVSSNGNPVVLIRDVKALAVRAGGYKMLNELVEALGE